MGLRKRIDLETFTARERPKDIIAKMPNLNRHDIYGGAPGYSAGGSSPDFSSAGYDPGCSDCLPLCDDKSLKLCAWPHGEVYWPTSVVSAEPATVEVLQYKLRYILPNHQGFGFPIPESQLQGYDETVGFKTYSSQGIIEPQPGDFYAYPSGVLPAQYKFAHGITLGGHWKSPSDDRFAPWRPLSSSPFVPIQANVEQVDSTISITPYRGSTDPNWLTNGRAFAPGTRIGTELFYENGPKPVTYVGTPQGTGARMTVHTPSMHVYDFNNPPVSGGGALAGHSLYLTISVFTLVGGIALEPKMYMFLGNVRGCAPPPGSVVDDDVAWIREADGSYHPPTPAAQPLAVYFDGLLAIPALHYTFQGGKIVPSTALVQGTKVVARYVADGNDQWP